MPGSLFLVATPIGNLEDITLRALRVLKQVDLIAAEDTRRTQNLLTHFGITTRTTSLHEHNERSKVPNLVRQVLEGRTVAVVTDAGMPAVSDPGYLIAREAIAAGLAVEIVPGVSALTTALAGAGLPTDDVRFLGFAPSRSAERAKWLVERLADFPGTVVLFEAPGRVPGLLAAIHKAAGDRFVVVAHELTKVHESWHRGWISELLSDETAELPARGEFVILVSNQTRLAATDATTPTSEAEVAAMFAELSRDPTLRRRDIINRLAETFALPNKRIYSMIERAKISGK